MNSFMFLMVGAVVLVFGTVQSSSKFHRVLKKHSGKVGYLPRAISMLVVTAQVPELVRVVQQASFVHIATSLFLLAILVATRSGTESELH